MMQDPIILGFIAIMSSIAGAFIWAMWRDYRAAMKRCRIVRKYQLNQGFRP
jgi:hypothetical protein